MTLRDATFAFFSDSDGNPTYADPWHTQTPQQKRPCPFGSDIYITGPAIGDTGSQTNAPSQYQYRVVYRHFGDTSSGFPVTNKISLTDLENPNPPHPIPPFTNPVSPLNGLGYFYFSAPQHNVGNLLSRWAPTDIDLYQIRLEVAIQTSPSVTVNPTYDTIGVTDWYNIQVNTISNPLGPIGAINFINEPVCGTFPVGTALNGTLWATSEYFYQYDIGIVGPFPHSISVSAGNPGPSEVPATSPIEWSLDTSGATPCGYTIELNVWDLTIYGSQPAGRYFRSFFQGFCLSPAT
jgi:hypothetical protein